MPQKDEILEELARIKRSAAFKKSSVGLQMLEYVVGKAVDNAPSSDFREAVVAARVYDGDYDAMGSPKVRTAMGRLRVALMSYYEGEGIKNPLRISFTADGYKPDFQYAKDTHPPAQAETAKSTAKEEGSAQSTTPTALANVHNTIYPPPTPNVNVQNTVNPSFAPNITVNNTVQPPPPPTVIVNTTVINQLPAPPPPSPSAPPSQLPTPSQSSTPPVSTPLSKTPWAISTPPMFSLPQTPEELRDRIVNSQPLVGPIIKALRFLLK